MTKDEAIRLAKEKGALYCSGSMAHYTHPPELAGQSCPDSISFNQDQLLAFANTIADAQREKYAKICEDEWAIDGSHTAKQFADAIRANKE